MYKKIVNFIKMHKLLIALAILAGIIYVTPNIFFSASSNYDGVTLSSLDGEIFYLARMQEVIDGHKDYTSTYFYEYKDGHEGIYQYSDIVIGYFLRFTKIDLIYFFVLSKFFFTVASFLLWYYFSLLISKNKTTATISSSLLFFGYYLFSSLNIPKQLSVLFFDSDNLSSLVMGRFPAPLVVYPFFILGLIYAYLFLKNNTIKNAVILGLLVSINLYLYIFFGVYLFVLVGIVAAYILFQKRIAAIKTLIILTGTIVLSGAYYFIAIINVMFLESINKTTADTLSIYSTSHEVIIPKVLILGIIILIGYLISLKYNKKKINIENTFLIFLLITTTITLNQQVITGKLVEDGHFHWYINVPIFYLVLSIIFYKTMSLFEEKRIVNKFFKGALIGGFVIYTIWFGVAVQISSYKNYFEMYDYYQVYGEVFDWLNQNSSPEDVILANSKLSLLIPVYTQNNIYQAREYPIHFNTYPYERRIDAFCLALYLEEGDKAQEKLSQLDDIWSYYSSYTYFNYYDSSIPDNLSHDLKIECSEYLQRPLEENLQKYRLDYIIWDKNIDTAWPIDEIKRADKVFDSNNIVIYKTVF